MQSVILPLSLMSPLPLLTCATATAVFCKRANPLRSITACIIVTYSCFGIGSNRVKFRGSVDDHLSSEGLHRLQHKKQACQDSINFVSDLPIPPSLLRTNAYMTCAQNSTTSPLQLPSCPLPCFSRTGPPGLCPYIYPTSCLVWLRGGLPLSFTGCHYWTGVQKFSNTVFVITCSKQHFWAVMVRWDCDE